MDQFEKLRQAKELYDNGTLTEAEYQKLKAQLMNDIDNVQASAQTAPAQQPAVIFYEGATTGLKVVSFLFPIVGLILFLVNMNTKPVEAKDELKWAGIGFGTGILAYILIFCIAFAGYSSYY